MNEVDYLRWVARLRNAGMRHPRDRADLDDVLAHLARHVPELESRTVKAAAKTEVFESGGQCFVVLEGDRGTGGLIVAEYVYGDVWTAWHRHRGVEKYTTLDGRIVDRRADGSVVRQHAGDPEVVHPPGSVHAPVIEGGWMGVFFQDLGSILVDISKAPDLAP